MFKMPFFLTIFLFFSVINLSADGSPVKEKTAKISSFEAFTGRITRDKVRIRLHPTLEAQVIREVNRGGLLVVVGEEDDFYAIQPFSDLKAYVYRTYVLDGVVEGNKVNVRLEPTLDSPVIGQLNSGDIVEGKISETGSKWLEIDPPVTTRFFISADYIEKVGNANFLAEYESRLKEVSNLINRTYMLSQAEMQKNFTDIDSETISENYQKVIDEYADFPEKVRQSKEFLAKFQDEYLHKKVDYLEAKSNRAPVDQKPLNLGNSFANRQERVMNFENDYKQAKSNDSYNNSYEQWLSEHFSTELSAKKAVWVPSELKFYERWSKKNENLSIQDFYQQQQNDALTLKGILEQYDRPVKNKPGDFILVNRINRLPIAYIYSTIVDLNELVGQEVSLKAALRPNNNFAYPAYFILTVE